MASLGEIESRTRDVFTAAWTLSERLKTATPDNPISYNELYRLKRDIFEPLDEIGQSINALPEGAAKQIVELAKVDRFIRSNIGSIPDVFKVLAAAGLDRIAAAGRRALQMARPENQGLYPWAADDGQRPVPIVFIDETPSELATSVPKETEQSSGANNWIERYREYEQRCAKAREFDLHHPESIRLSNEANTCLNKLMAESPIVQAIEGIASDIKVGNCFGSEQLNGVVWHDWQRWLKAAREGRAAIVPQSGSANLREKARAVSNLLTAEQPPVAETEATGGDSAVGEATVEAVAGRLKTDKGQQPAINSHEPLTVDQERVLDYIRSNGPVMGAAIAAALNIGQSTLTRHHIPACKRHGVKNKSGAGYYVEGHTA